MMNRRYLHHPSHCYILTFIHGQEYLPQMMQLGLLRSGTRILKRRTEKMFCSRTVKKRPFFRSSLITFFPKILTLSSAWGIMIIQQYCNTYLQEQKRLDSICKLEGR